MDSFCIPSSFFKWLLLLLCMDPALSPSSYFYSFLDHKARWLAVKNSWFFQLTLVMFQRAKSHCLNQLLTKQIFFVNFLGPYTVICICLQIFTSQQVSKKHLSHFPGRMSYMLNDKKITKAGIVVFFKLILNKTCDHINIYI